MCLACQILTVDSGTLYSWRMLLILDNMGLDWDMREHCTGGNTAVHANVLTWPYSCRLVFFSNNFWCFFNLECKHALFINELNWTCLSNFTFILYCWYDCWFHIWFKAHSNADISNYFLTQAQLDTVSQVCNFMLLMCENVLGICVKRWQKLPPSMMFKHFFP